MPEHLSRQRTLRLIEDRAVRLEAHIRKYKLGLDEAVTKYARPAPAGARLTEPYGAQSYDADDGEMMVPFILTSEIEDRDGDTVVVAGRDGSDYDANPIVLFGHDSQSLPIGHSLDPRTGRAAVYVRGKQIIQHVWFDKEDPFAREVYRKIKAKLLSGISVAFIPLEAYKKPGGRGFVYERWIHTESSIVPLPSNPQALAILTRAARSLGISPRRLRAVERELTVCKSWYGGLCGGDDDGRPPGDEPEELHTNGNTRYLSQALEEEFRQLVHEFVRRLWLPPS
jgi:hypothetical protein